MSVSVLGEWLSSDGVTEVSARVTEDGAAIELENRPYQCVPTCVRAFLPPEDARQLARAILRGLGDL